MNERALRAAWKDRVFEIRVSRNNKTEMFAKFFFFTLLLESIQAAETRQIVRGTT